MIESDPKLFYGREFRQGFPADKTAHKNFVQACKIEVNSINKEIASLNTRLVQLKVKKNLISIQKHAIAKPNMLTRGDLAISRTRQNANTWMLWIIASYRPFSYGSIYGHKIIDLGIAADGSILSKTASFDIVSAAFANWLTNNNHLGTTVRRQIEYISSSDRPQLVPYTSNLYELAMPFINHFKTFVPTINP